MMRHYQVSLVVSGASSDFARVAMAEAAAQRGWLTENVASDLLFLTCSWTALQVGATFCGCGGHQSRGERNGKD